MEREVDRLTQRERRWTNAKWAIAITCTAVLALGILAFDIYREWRIWMR